MKTVDLNELYKKGMQFHTITNTAYPLTPTSLKQYAIRDDSKIKELLIKDMESMNTLSLYVHIPFCKSRCKFCEYVVTSGPENNMKDEYTDAVLKEIGLYIPHLNNKRFVGFDIGGGTPTELGFRQIEKITNKIIKSFDLDSDLTWSIETTPYNAVNKLDDLKEIHNLGFKRISMGLQTVNTTLLEKMEREGSLHMYERAVDNIRTAGYKKLNIDLMYGFKEQSVDDFRSTVEYVVHLGPEYVTLYEMRYKMTRIAKDGLDVTLDKVNQQYHIAYQILTANGYTANYGKNTFSKIPSDYGTSDYLTNRVIKATPYIGIGAGAQSYGCNYLSYNDGAATKRISKYISSVNNGRFPIQDMYDLPEQEVMAKAISVMFYFCFVDLQSFKDRFDRSFTEVFPDEIAYLTARNLVKLDHERFTVTPEGVKQLSGIIPMFYSDRSKDELMNMDLHRILK